MMRQRLRYNSATGTWMPDQPLRPKRALSAPMQPATVGNPLPDRIPIQPAPPVRPKLRMPNIGPYVSGPKQEILPTRPLPVSPIIPQLPKRIRDQAKYGQVKVSGEGPEVLPPPPKRPSHRYNASVIEQEQKRIYKKMQNRGLGKPLMPPVAVARKRLRKKDLGNTVTSSTSKYMGGIGNSSGRSF